jgi:Fe-S-cluster-containing hydrogenase component 2
MLNKSIYDIIENNIVKLNENTCVMCKYCSYVVTRFMRIVFEFTHSCQFYLLFMLP